MSEQMTVVELLRGMVKERHISVYAGVRHLGTVHKWRTEQPKFALYAKGIECGGQVTAEEAADLLIKAATQRAR